MIQQRIDDWKDDNHAGLELMNTLIDDLALRWNMIEGHEDYHYELVGHCVPKFMPWKRWLHGYKTALSNEKLFIIEQLVKSAPAGACVEFGVFTGGVTRMLLDMGREVYAFDTFEGIAGAGSNDTHQDGEYNGGDISDYIKGAVIVKGRIPESLDDVQIDCIAFAHIDMDVYEPTKAALDYVWNRLHINGVIVIDDYGNITTRGVKKAVDEFPYGKKLFLANSQMIIRK